MMTELVLGHYKTTLGEFTQTMMKTLMTDM